MRKLYSRETYDIFKIIKGKFRGKKSGGNGFSVYPAPPKNGPAAGISAGNVDGILDKISRSGINSLTQEELNILKKAREQMRNNT